MLFQVLLIPLWLFLTHEETKEEVKKGKRTSRKKKGSLAWSLHVPLYGVLKFACPHSYKVKSPFPPMSPNGVISPFLFVDCRVAAAKEQNRVNDNSVRNSLVVPSHPKPRAYTHYTEFSSLLTILLCSIKTKKGKLFYINHILPLRGISLPTNVPAVQTFIV